MQRRNKEIKQNAHSKCKSKSKSKFNWNVNFIKKFKTLQKKKHKEAKENYFNDKMLELYKGCGDHGVEWSEVGGGEIRIVYRETNVVYVHIFPADLYSLPLSLLYLLYLCTMQCGTLTMYRTKRGKASCNIVVALLFLFFFLSFLMNFLVFVFRFLSVCLPC